MQDSQAMIRLLESSNPDDIREGAFLAGEYRDKKAISYLTPHLLSPNVGVLDAVDNALRHIGGVEVVEAVLPLLRSDNAPCRNLAMDILRFLAPTSPEAIQAHLQDSDADIRIFIADILGSTKSALVVSDLCNALLHDPEVNVRYQAAVSLGSISSASAVDCLKRSLGDEEWVQFASIEALAKMKASSAISALVAALGSSSDLVASTIVDALGEMGDIKAVPLLLRHLNNAPTPLANKIVRAVVSILGEKSLGLLGAKECKRLREYMLVALEDEDVEVQDAAIKGFSILGGQEASAKILRIGAALNPDRDSDRLVAISRALAQIGFSPVLENGAYAKDERTQDLALAALVRMSDPAALSLLKNIFNEGSVKVQRNIIYALGDKATNVDQDFFMAILAKTADGNVIRGCLEFLGKKGTPEHVQETLLSFLKHPYNDVKESALLACITMNTEYIHNALKDLLKHTDIIQRVMAVYALGQLDVNKYVEDFVLLLDDPAYEVRREVVKALGKACEHNNQCYGILHLKLDDEHREVRLAAIEALGECAAISIEESFILGLDDIDPWVRVRCVEKLGNAKSLEAVPKLVSMLQDENNIVVIKAAEALGKIGGESAFRALMELLNHQEPDVQMAASEAIDNIRNSAGV